jgi:ABC-type transport system involved in cytochrome c biogenesis permease subunit
LFGSLSEKERGGDGSMSSLVLKCIACIAAVFYYSAFFLNFSKKINPIVSFLIWIAGFAANLTLVIHNYLVNGYVPFVSIYQVLTFLGACFFLIYLYMRFVRQGEWMRPYFQLMPAIIMTGLCFMDAVAVWEFAPSLQSVWFVPHILVYMIAYTMGAVAFLICLVSLFSTDKKKKERLEQGVYDCICVVFPFMTMGMFFGAIWANEVWGAFWSWDTKEIWSLVTWLTYMLYLHFRREPKLKKFSSILAILGFVGIIITFFFVNIMSSSGNHSYSV